MNITELARKLKVPTQELREKLPELGFDIGMRAIKVDDSLVDKIVDAWDEMKSREETKKEREQIKRIELDEKQTKTGSEDEKVVRIPKTITVHTFAEKIGLPVSKVIAELMKNGFIATINESIDFETAAIIADDLGITVEKGIETEEEVEDTKLNRKQLKRLFKENGKKDLKVRPPVVVIMGHVDHGKTSLLDAIRETNVVAKEAGAITQHIGAYQVLVPLKGERTSDIPHLARDDNAQEHVITFIDTPGHEAFKAMRARGGKVADIAVLVVAADEGIRPQTLESIKVIEEENLAFIVAINKIDKEGADLDKIKKELSEINLSPEDWGGKTICIPVSAITKQGLDDLMEMILLVADMEKENLKADPKRPAVGTVIETHLDKNEGPVATVIIQTGTLKLGDSIIVGKTYGNVKALRDFQRHNIPQAFPSMPVEVLGLKTIPQVGDIVQVITDKRLLQRKIKKGELDRKQGATLVRQLIDRQTAKDQKGTNLNLILKADKLGSLEAITEALEQTKYQEVNASIIKKGLGNITESDVLQADAASKKEKTLVIGFNVGVNPEVGVLAQERKIPIKVYNIIYELLDDIKRNLEALLSPEQVRIDLGELEILQIFRKEINSMIVGGRVTKGKIVKGALVDIVREDRMLGSGYISEVQINKQKVDEVKSGSECGIKFEGKAKIEIEDILEVYRIEEKTKSLK